MVLGRNPVVECLRADVPATALYIAQGTSNDDRLTEAINTAKAAGLPIQEVSRKELDRLSENGMHQGIALEIPPYKYADPSELIDIARQKGEAPLIVVLDNITDPRNLGAAVRSTAAFGGHGVVIPERRSASMTAVAWRTSAGTAARLRVAAPLTSPAPYRPMRKPAAKLLAWMQAVTPPWIITTAPAPLLSSWDPKGRAFRGLSPRIVTPLCPFPWLVTSKASMRLWHAV